MSAKALCALASVLTGEERGGPGAGGRPMQHRPAGRRAGLVGAAVRSRASGPPPAAPLPVDQAGGRPQDSGRGLGPLIGEGTAPLGSPSLRLGRALHVSGDRAGGKMGACPCGGPRVSERAQARVGSGRAEAEAPSGRPTVQRHLGRSPEEARESAQRHGSGQGERVPGRGREGRVPQRARQGASVAAARSREYGDLF